MKSLKGLACAVVLLAGFAVAQGAVVPVDDFTGPRFILFIPSDNPPTQVTDTVTNADANIINGSRDVTLTVPDDGGAPPLPLASAEASILWPGILNFSGGTIAGPAGATVELEYDLGSLDAVAEGISFLQLNIQNEKSIDVMVTIDGGSTMVTVPASPNDLQNVFIDLGDLGLGSLNDLDDLSVKLITTEPATDSALDFIRFTDIPEPASLALVALGSLMIARRRKR